MRTHYTAREAKKLATTIRKKEREEGKRKSEQWCKSNIIPEIKAAASEGLLSTIIYIETPDDVRRDVVCRYLRSIGYTASIITGGYLVKW